ncbi:hypothetical protein PR048_027094 [Dryococelus australis]|uniref:Uncharacterized protein n=1 Tax=Dryococelus australis TaxID=614101 RepID=A0ABQ9GEH3_9NEOP|nr:hypothetical protein PR048_027094 [Dryococelus australis]
MFPTTVELPALAGENIAGETASFLGCCSLAPGTDSIYPPLTQLFRSLLSLGGRGGVVVRLLASHQGKPCLFHGRVAPGFSQVTMTMVGGFYRGAPVSPALEFQRCFILISFYVHRLSRSLRWPLTLEPLECSFTTAISLKRWEGKGESDVNELFYRPLTPAPLAGDFLAASSPPPLP